MYKTHLITRYYVASIFVKGKYYRPLSNLQKSSDWNNFWHKNTLLQNKQNGIVCIPIYRKKFFTIHMWTTLMERYLAKVLFFSSCFTALSVVYSVLPFGVIKIDWLAKSYLSIRRSVDISVLYDIWPLHATATLAAQQHPEPLLFTVNSKPTGLYYDFPMGLQYHRLLCYFIFAGWQFFVWDFWGQGNLEKPLKSMPITE